MATAMESPLAYPESPLDPEEAAYPCKGCGLILEEGKAFELAGNRWHIDCFRCNTCGTLLDSDANLLLLGDGSLICNNCTYSCSNCGNKIEDLAILTGDQAFCANCFKCRNCKRKIENLRYARTSQGIFCMDCHEALMARRRKKTARNTAQRSKLSNNTVAQLDKSLPAIPPPGAEARKTAYIPEAEPTKSELTSADTQTTSDAKATPEVQRDSPQYTPEIHHPAPPEETTVPEQPVSRDALTLPSTTFRNNRQSYMSQRSDMSGGGEEFLIPMTFDPTPPMKQSPAMPTSMTPKTVEEKPRDYFTSKSGSSQLQQMSQSKNSSPHIAYQEKGRQASREVVDQMRNKHETGGSRSTSAAASPFLPEPTRQRTEGSPRVSQTARTDILPSERFRLQDAPRTKRLTGSQRSSRSEASTARAAPETSALMAGPVTTPMVQEPDASPETDYSTPRISNESSPVQPGLNESPRPAPHPQTSLLQSLPKRGDSLDGSKRQQTIPRKELNSSAAIPQAVSDVLDAPATNAKPPNLPIDLQKANGGKIISAPIESPESKSIFDTPSLLQQQGEGGEKLTSESFVDPRVPPLPPTGHRSRNESISTMQSDRKYGESQRSPGLPRYSAGGDFTLDEDMARILGEEPNAHESFLRRVSNSVRHGRSYSDKGGRMSRERWPRSPVVGGSGTLGQDISSPSTASPEHRDDLSWFKNELKRERQKTIEREKKIAELEAQLDSTANIKQVNSELKEKRSTMVVLDTQKEIVVRELEVLTEHIAAAKSSGEPFDVQKMSSGVLREFAEALEKLKNSFAPQIEDSIQRRNDLVDEIANLTQMKDKSFMEFEQLSSKNAQLAELNNQLVHQIQELYKANSGQGVEPVKPSMNGLGIYSHHKDKSQMSLESPAMRNMSTDASFADSATTLQAGEAEPAQLMQGPHVVSIRKGVQPRKFDWRKGQKVAKGVTKGLKGAFSSTQQSYSREMQFAETGAYGGGAAPGIVGQEYSNMPRNNQEPMKQAGFGFFGGGARPPTKLNGLYVQQQNNASTPSLLLDASNNLFGSDLEQRAEYEKTSIPVIVIRCIEEVEARGMDVEGIYRKSGGNSQVQQVREGFERSPTDCDISDPDLDIHAVTSGLKQYFRRLPSPLITYEVYDKLLETTQIPDKESRIEAMTRAVESLPKVHYEVLEFLVRHLSRVVEFEKENLMTSMNVAVVFAPTIMRPMSLERELSDTKMKNEVVQWLVEEVDVVF